MENIYTRNSVYILRQFPERVSQRHDISTGSVGSTTFRHASAFEGGGGGSGSGLKFAKDLAFCESVRSFDATDRPHALLLVPLFDFDDTMLTRIFILMIFTFLLEGWILIRMVMETSFLFTFFLCLFTSLLGLSLMRGAVVRLQQGTQRAMSGTGTMGQAVGGALIQLVAGVLLLMPGILTDIAGALLMLPPLHQIALRRASVSKFVREGQFTNMPFGQQFSGFQDASSASQTQSAAPKQQSAPSSFIDPDAPPPDDTYEPPRPSSPENVILDAEIVDDP